MDQQEANVWTHVIEARRMMWLADKYGDGDGYFQRSALEKLNAAHVIMQEIVKDINGGYRADEEISVELALAWGEFHEQF